MKPGDLVLTEDGSHHLLRRELEKSPHPCYVVDAWNPAWEYESGQWDYERSFRLVSDPTLDDPRLFDAFLTA